MDNLLIERKILEHAFMNTSDPVAINYFALKLQENAAEISAQSTPSKI